jgi:hypothetical protein
LTCCGERGRLGGMDMGGRVPVDAPDPAVGQRAEVRQLGFPVAGMVRQRHLEELGMLGTVTSRSGADDTPPEAATVARSYTLWRNPDDRADPGNLRADGDVLDHGPLPGDEPPRPPWLVALADQVRYPMLWEAVQTHWSDGTRPTESVAERLAHHVDHLLHNRFREEHALPSPVDGPWVELVTASAVRSGHPVVVDGVPHEGFLLDTDPFVLGVAVELDDGRVLTVALPREELPLVELALVSDAPLDPAT